MRKMPSLIILDVMLPKLTADYQEKHNLSQVDVYGSEDARFPTTYHVLDCMKLIAYGYEEVDLESGKVHSPEEISEICQNTLDYLGDNYLIWEDSRVVNESKKVFLAVKKEGNTNSAADSSIISGTEKQVLEKESYDKGRYSDITKTYDTIVSSDSVEIYDSGKDVSDLDVDNEPQTISAIIWECTIQDQYGNEVTLWIDDLSGKMISFQCVFDTMFTEEMGYFYLDNANSVVLTEFFKEYYGFSDVYQLGDYLEESLLIFTDKSDEQAAVYMSVSHAPETIYFNPH